MIWVVSPSSCFKASYEPVTIRELLLWNEQRALDQAAAMHLGRGASAFGYDLAESIAHLDRDSKSGGPNAHPTALEKKIRRMYYTRVS